jgi:RNA polymerase sigma-70 factor, ECF subfamily
VTTSKQEAQWVLRAQFGDRDALEALLRAVAPSLRRYVCGLVIGADADDVLQDVLVVICRKLVWLRSPELFRPWAFRIANRTAVRHLKKQTRWSDRAAADTDLDTLAAPTERPADGAMERLLATDVLSPAARAVLVLHFQEEMTLAEVAAVLELPLGTVKSRLAAGLAALRKHLRTGGDPHE